MTPDAGAQPAGLSRAGGAGPRELPHYRSAQGRWVVAAMISVTATTVESIPATDDPKIMPQEQA